MADSNVQPTTTEHRDYSVIQRRFVAGQPVYVKQCLPGCRYDTTAQAQAQVSREVEFLERIVSWPGFGGRLGVLKIVEFDPSNAIITTPEVPGVLLSDILRHGRQKKLRGSGVRAMYLAGRWLRVFQTVPVDESVPRSSPSNPEDLVEHCDLRLKMLMELGYPWPGPTARERLLKWLRQKVESASKEQTSKVWCHGDYGPYNMIWDGRVLTPIDFTGFAQDVPLADVTYLIHRLEMLPIEIPWRTWPVALWRKAYLRGYGVPDAERSPMYSALLVRWLLSRLKKLAQRKPTTSRDWCRDRWCRHWVRKRLLRLLDGAAAS